MCVWQGVAMDSLKYHSGLPYLTFLYPVGMPSLQWPYNHFRGGPPAGWVVYGPYPFEPPHAIRLWPLLKSSPFSFLFFCKHGKRRLTGDKKDWENDGRLWQDSVEMECGLRRVSRWPQQHDPMATHGDKGSFAKSQSLELQHCFSDDPKMEETLDNQNAANRRNDKNAFYSSNIDLYTPLLKQSE
jgi:hypothetical protein